MCCLMDDYEFLVISYKPPLNKHYHSPDDSIGVGSG